MTLTPPDMKSLFISFPFPFFLNCGLLSEGGPWGCRLSSYFFRFFFVRGQGTSVAGHTRFLSPLVRRVLRGSKSRQRSRHPPLWPLFRNQLFVGISSPYSLRPALKKFSVRFLPPPSRPSDPRRLFFFSFISPPFILYSQTPYLLPPFFYSCLCFCCRRCLTSPNPDREKRLTPDLTLSPSLGLSTKEPVFSSSP